ncbi:hypothetical protein PGB90_009885 [Kerria lacca]
MTENKTLNTVEPVDRSPIPNEDFKPQRQLSQSANLFRPDNASTRFQNLLTAEGNQTFQFNSSSGTNSHFQSWRGSSQPPSFLESPQPHNPHQIPFRPRNLFEQIPRNLLERTLPRNATSVLRLRSPEFQNQRSFEKPEENIQFKKNIFQNQNIRLSPASPWHRIREKLAATQMSPQSSSNFYKREMESTQFKNQTIPKIQNCTTDSFEQQMKTSPNFKNEPMLTKAEFLENNKKNYQHDNKDAMILGQNNPEQETFQRDTFLENRNNIRRPSTTNIQEHFQNIRRFVISPENINQVRRQSIESPSDFPGSVNRTFNDQRTLQLIPEYPDGRSNDVYKKYIHEQALRRSHENVHTDKQNLHRKLSIINDNSKELLQEAYTAESKNIRNDNRTIRPREAIGFMQRQDFEIRSRYKRSKNHNFVHEDRLMFDKEQELGFRKEIDDPASQERFGIPSLNSGKIYNLYNHVS